jgi:hypothetical protein
MTRKPTPKVVELNHAALALPVGDLGLDTRGQVSEKARRV